MKEKKAYTDSIFLKMVNDADNYPVYNGTDLGLTYSPKKSVFKLWSPPAKSVNLFFYDKGSDGKRLSSVKMKKGKNGVKIIKNTLKNIIKNIVKIIKIRLMKGECKKLLVNVVELLHLVIKHNTKNQKFI